MSRCKSCGVPIRWERTASGKPIPLDPEPTPDGTIGIRDDGRAVSWIGFEPGTPRYTTHFATCPNASEHRRR